MSILVPGGKGFIGARVIRRLVELGQEVVCLEPKASAGRLGDLAARVTMVEGDVSRYEDMAEAIARHKVDRIAHMVFFMAEERGVSVRPENADGLYRQQMVMDAGTFHLFEAARIAGIRRIVYPSSVQYHGLDAPWTDPQPVNEDSPARPTTLYGMGKMLCERLAHEYNRLHGMEIVSIRVSGAYGPGVQIGARGINLIGTRGALGEAVHFPYRRDQHIVLAHVDDIAEIMVRALLGERAPLEVYHVGGHYASFGDMGELGQRLLPGMPVTYKDDAPMMCSYRIDCSRMERDIGVTHRSLEAGYGALINETRLAHGLAPVALAA